ncbi:unannotated protein [freshwater metagenome]|uniref:Unannotated protein n=1 Tax=freshwater metagenome TaxID=449393 RepID=A0A6J7ICJ9_9ZZZZ|nr:hypothetical protein [Actinomycetota bacterium]
MLSPRRAIGPFMAGMGVLHLAVPKVFAPAMPSYLPAHRELILLSGAVELVAGTATMHPRTRRAGRLLAAATIVAVFPANVEMAMHPERFPKLPGGRRTLIARLPLQVPMFFLALRAGGRD